MSDKIAVSSRVPVTRQMVSQLDFYRTNLKWNEVLLNDPPYPLPDSCYNYGNLDAECIRMIKTKSPEEQQMLLKCRLELLVEENNKQVRLLEEEIGDDGAEILNENDDEEVPDNIMFAVFNGEVDTVLTWLRAPCDDRDNGVDRINMKSSSNGFGNSILNLTLYEGHKYFAIFLLQKFGPNVDSIDGIGGTPLVHACKGANNNYDQHYSDAVLLLEWGANKNTGVVERNDAIGYARRLSNKKLLNLLENPLGGRRCEIFGLQSRSDLNGRLCFAGKYLNSIGRYIVRIGEERGNNEYIKIKSSNLKRRDRTTDDPGDDDIEFLGLDPETKNYNWKFCTREEKSVSKSVANDYCVD
jgi:hypothetical protein